ncbi:DNA-binding transcriptional regulator, LysR family [Pseudooceanicola antarcticus]|uniref:DNA-binding transcriptional regulator, LysR family n=1 Tax=Pseudooceanicola antarcticus TaxID=1247613 RepID=A0A285HV87_9RHOB|nr:LysR family transcriptional regulator [Pseudooceanicola antarcticus]PJE27459.1 LysR family transcriptional regulator [Pseudooceanicola antarcticus]SNY39563.1 DNA-binding transcriptional regulator, LysR family [Pseudooceanicola antarcticus]
MKWNLRHLRVFLAVARLSSVSRAAEECNLSQPAVTQAMAKLERMLGQPLFRHQSQGLFATPAGELLAARVRRALDRIDEAAAPISPRLSQTATRAQLEALIALRELENFTLAARQLGLAQPTVHRAVSALESEARRPLFERSAMGLRSSRAARALADAARLAFAELDQAVMELAELEGREAGEIVIGALPLSRSSILARAIIAFRRTRPRISIRIAEGRYDDLLRGLRMGDIDFLLGALRDPLPIGDVVQQALFEDEVILVVGPDHPMLDREDLTLGELAALPWVVARRATPTRQIFDQLFEGRDRPESVVETGSLILMRQLLRESDHIGIVSGLQVASEIDLGLLVPLPFQPPDGQRLIGLTSRVGWIPTAAQQAMIGELEKAVRQRSY